MDWFKGNLPESPVFNGESDGFWSIFPRCFAPPSVGDIFVHPLDNLPWQSVISRSYPFVDLRQ